MLRQRFFSCCGPGLRPFHWADAPELTTLRPTIRPSPATTPTTGRIITHTIRGTVTTAARTTPNIDRADPGKPARLGPGLLDRGNLRRGFIHPDMIPDSLDF